jgi:hypothetical protein
MRKCWTVNVIELELMLKSAIETPFLKHGRDATGSQILLLNFPLFLFV